MTTVIWTEYTDTVKRVRKIQVPTSALTAESDHAGITTTAGRSYEYNHLGQLTQITDDAGIRTLGYNEYGEATTDSLTADNVTHLITETRDEKGRSTGYTYAKNGTVQQTVTTGYDANGRIATAGFVHGGEEKQFSYSYLAGSNLLQTLTMPNGMTLTQSYEAQRDLLTGMTYHRGSTLVTQRSYSYDAPGRPTARTTARQGTTRNDTFAYNNRSELINAVVGDTTHAYDYDNIGNRRMAIEGERYSLYQSNALNQYTSIRQGRGEEAPESFAPEYDADGNQTKVRTSTGIWSVEYNAENRPIHFTRTGEDGSTTQIACTYDHMGRRATKKVTTNGAVTLHRRYLYRGYLQIAACDQTRSGHPCLWHLTWDPTQPVATRPLALQKDGAWYTYGWDLTKNICEVYKTNGGIGTAYTYTPYGEVSTTGNVTQPIQWSSEHADPELGLTYYNYRHYNPSDGRWLGRDLLNEPQNTTLYVYVSNTRGFDYLGLFAPGWEGGQAGSCATSNRYKASNMASKTNCGNCCPKGSRHRGVGSSCEYRTERQKKGYTASSNGCGAENGIKVPDKWFGGEVDFLPACNAHDICYGTCGSDFEKCNDDFMRDMKKACDKGINRAQAANPNLPLEEVRRKCYDIAETYYRAVSIFGRSPYESAQDIACEWASCRK